VDVVKGRLKRLIGKRYYSVEITLIASIFPFNYLRKILSHIDPKKVIVVDLGAGNHRISDDIVSLDGTDYEAVDLVADLTALPFKNNSIHCFCSCGVLEHIPDISLAVKEITRCTQRDGLSIHLIPFLFLYHESPGNYQRLMHSGVATLFGAGRWWNKDIIGPISLLLPHRNRMRLDVSDVGESTREALCLSPADWAPQLLASCVSRKLVA
jgi:hypothetical protein